MADESKPSAEVATIGVAIAAVGLYYAYTQGWLNSLFGLSTVATAPLGTAVVATPAGTASTVATPIQSQPAPVSTPAAPVPAQTATGFTGTYLGADLTSPVGLAYALMLAAGNGVASTASLTVDQWNYYLSKITGIQQSNDFSGAPLSLTRGTPAFTMTAAQYVADRSTEGLSGLGQAHGGTFRMPRRSLTAARWGHR